MIPFGSQRGLGQDLATHLMNEHDNEYQEVSQVRGAIADDLHGAFAEWESQASSLTKCQNYLYSLSVNPDPEQPLSRDQYLDYIDRAEEKLGLSDQPRAVVFHIKNGREHCHVVWSRIDAREGKAVQMAFDREKLMMVTREFARDHGLTLPDGYYKDRGNEQEKSKQLSLYEKAQQDNTGITKEDRMALVTQLWKSSDSAKAFVQALEDNGYILATGKRPYVLVDIYGCTNALPKLIGDRSVRTKDIREFLANDFPPESLPSIDDAMALAKQHRRAIEDFSKAKQKDDRLQKLVAAQTARRDKCLVDIAALKERQEQDRTRLQKSQDGKQREFKQKYLEDVKRLNDLRAQNRPAGLAAFLGRVTGVNLIVGKLQKMRDARKQAQHQSKLQEMRLLQKRERDMQQRQHELAAMELQRALRALDQIDQRERQSLETSQKREQRAQVNGRYNHMPSIALDMKPRGRFANVTKAKNRHRRNAMASEIVEAAKEVSTKRRKRVNLFKDFTRAARDDDSDRADGKSGEGKGTPPLSKPKNKKNKKDRNDRDKNGLGPKGRDDDRGPGR